MKLTELTSTRPSVAAVIAALKGKLNLIQVGGSGRFFHIRSSGQISVVYVVDGLTRGIAFAWSQAQNTIETVYVWNRLDVGVYPDFAIDIPIGITAEQIGDQLAVMVQNPHIGPVTEGLLEADVPVPANDDEPGAAESEPAPASEPVATPQEKPSAQVIPIQPDRNNGPVLVARKGDGAAFEIPSLEPILNRLDKQVEAELNDGEAGSAMEEQYDTLLAKVRAVVGNKNRFIKAILIYGAPSSGKSFRIMQVIKEMGLTRGRDYILKKGKVTTASLYRLFIEQVNGMIVFDDCDSIWDDDNAANMMKGALDTDPVRSISYDTRNSMNTGAMEPEERDRLINAMSRILRGRPGSGDLELFKNRVKDFSSHEDHSEEAFERDLAEVQKYITMHPPSDIDFRGRVVFISNRSDFDSAVLTRIDAVHLDFGNEEMLDYIEKIADSLEGTREGEVTSDLSKDEIAEVIDYVRQRLRTNGFNDRVNFRFMQKCFDYRRNQPHWKKLIDVL